MASSPESPGTQAGPSSSPPTFYSPDLARMSSKQAGKQKVDNATSFLNEVHPEQDGFISRYLILDDYPMDINPESRLVAIENQMKHYACFVHCVPLVVRDIIRLRFDDVNDACEAQLLLTQLTFTVRFITHLEFAAARFQDLTPAMESEGQILVAVTFRPHPSVSQQKMIETATHYALSTAGRCGKVREHVVHRVSASVDETSNTVVKLRLEMYSVDAANRTVQHAVAYPFSGETDAIVERIQVRPWIQPSSLASSTMSTPPLDRYGRLTGYRLQSTAVVIRHPSDAMNRVRQDRVLDGSDVRTTVMLRNIPNKLDKLELKSILDKICFGRYDFVYLRIDFSTAANVGYAFINVTDMHGLLAIVQRLDGHMWDGFRTAKAAEVSYATIQGREALEQKFRNSSVMKEAPFCRPDVYMTFELAHLKQSQSAYKLVGTQIAFPPPDNPAKLQRSMDSARQIGLYPPHGAGAAIDHRNRMSIWDRGTPRDLQVVMQQPFNTVTELARRSIEMWFAHYQGQHTPFSAIPMAAVRDFMQQHPWMFAAQPGVIGQRAPAGLLMPASIVDAGHFQYTG